MSDLSSVRITRLGAGTALALLISQGINWPAAFLCPVLVGVLLTLPLPCMRPKQLAGFIAVLSASLLIGLLITPVIIQMPAAGLLLIVLLLFLVFRFAASGGSPPLANFLSVGIAAVPVIGAGSLSYAVVLFQALVLSAIAAAAIVGLIQTLIPDPVSAQTAPADAPSPVATHDAAESARLARRSTLIVSPLLLGFLMMSNSQSYLAVLIKGMSLGQQACVEQRRAESLALISSTVIGGLMALAIWFALKIWPSLLIYTLLVLLAGFWVGPRIFKDDGLTANGSMWSYAFITALIVIGPTATAGEGGDPAISALLLRIALMLAASVYAAAAMRLHDRLFPDRRPARSALSPAAQP